MKRTAHAVWGFPLLAALSACGSHHAPGEADAANADAPVLQSDAPDTSPDAALGPSGVECFYDWQGLDTCAAPVITAAFLTQNCSGTTGIFVVGHGFESANLFDVNNGWIPHGPRALPQQLNRDTWNVLTPTFLCITTSADPQYWTGFSMQVRNPDGQDSNVVTVTNQLSSRPPLPSTDSTDPFDPDACLEDGMTQQQALTYFSPGASTAMIGTVNILTHSRACNVATGCAAWTAPTTAATAPIGLAIAGGGHVDLTLGTTDCGRLGANDYTLTYNSCGAYAVHVAAQCLQVSSAVRSPVASNGSYTQTESNAVLHF